VKVVVKTYATAVQSLGIKSDQDAVYQRSIDWYLSSLSISQRTLMLSREVCCISGCLRPVVGRLLN
jgi:hypothetical protein